MSPPVPESDLRELWQNIETEGTTVSAEQIRLKALEFLQKNRRDLIAKLVFALIASVFCGFVVMNASLTAVRIVAALVMAMLLTTTVKSLYLSYSQGAPRFLRGEGAPWSSCLQFYRNELEKQQALAALPAWQMLTALLIIAWLTSRALLRNSTDPLRIVMLAVLFAAAGLIALMAVRKFQSRRVQGDLESLNSFEKENHAGGGDDIPLSESKG